MSRHHVVSKPQPPIRSRSGALEVHQIPAWQDNFIWLLVDRATGDAAAIDGPEAEPLLEYCRRQGIRLTAVFNTHTHPDHIGLNRELEQRGLLGPLRVVGAAATAKAIPGLTEAVGEGDRVCLGASEGRVMVTEGHIDGHISYLFEDFLFCGDTLFAGGCGFLFDGPPEKMFRSLSRLADLDPGTRVLCAHEYTQDNLRFAWSIEPGNLSLARRIRDVWRVRQDGGATVPSTVAVERATNPFLRWDSSELRNHVRAAMPEVSLTTSAQVFAATRALKDRKDYRRLVSEQDLPLEAE